MNLFASLDKKSAATMTLIVRRFFAENFYASRRAGGCEINYVVPGHSLMIATAGRGATWTEALAKAVLATGVKAVGS